MKTEDKTLEEKKDLYKESLYILGCIFVYMACLFIDQNYVNFIPYKINALCCGVSAVFLVLIWGGSDPVIEGEGTPEYYGGNMVLRIAGLFLKGNFFRKSSILKDTSSFRKGGTIS